VDGKQPGHRAPLLVTPPAMEAATHPLKQAAVFATALALLIVGSSKAARIATIEMAPSNSNEFKCSFAWHHDLFFSDFPPKRKAWPLQLPGPVHGMASGGHRADPAHQPWTGTPTLPYIVNAKTLQGFRMIHTVMRST